MNFGANAATFTVNNATTITATAPAGTGTVDVTVTTPGGTSTTSAADQFTYVAATAAGFDPVAGGGRLAAERLGAARDAARRRRTCS